MSEVARSDALDKTSAYLFSWPSSGPMQVPLASGLTGYNTDCIGAVRALEEATTLKGQRVALLGAGGAARAIAWGMRRAGARITLFNRTVERGQAFAIEFDIAFGGALARLAIYRNNACGGLSGSVRLIESILRCRE